MIQVFFLKFGSTTTHPEEGLPTRCVTKWRESCLNRTILAYTTPRARHVVRHTVHTHLNDVVRQRLGAVEHVDASLRFLSVHGEVELVGIFHGRLELEGLHTVPLLAVVASSEDLIFERGVYVRSSGEEGVNRGRQRTAISSLHPFMQYS